MNEFELIQRLTRSLPTNPSVVVGAGDDCAVLDAGVPDRLLLFKTDAVVEGVHFTPATRAGEDRPQSAGPVFERYRGHGRDADRGAGDDWPAARVQPRPGRGDLHRPERPGATAPGGHRRGRNDHQPRRHPHFGRAAGLGAARQGRAAFRRGSRRRDLCDGRTGRLAGRQASRIRAAPGGGALARATVLPARHAGHQRRAGGRPAAYPARPAGSARNCLRLRSPSAGRPAAPPKPVQPPNRPCWRR